MAQQAEQLRVFVSHSHKDNTFCHQIVQALRDAGADVWYDEHNLGWGQLKDEIIRELGIRPVFVLILSKAVFASRWVKKETDWAEELYDRDPSRLMIFVNSGQIERADFGTDNGWLAFYGYKRIEAPGFAPYPVAEAANRLLRALALTPAGEAPAPVAPQLTESVADLLTRGKALVAQKQFAEALPLFERATQLTPGSFDAWANLGLACNEMGRHGDDLQAYDRALALDDKNAAAWYNKGRSLNDLGRHDEALVAYDRALALDSNLAVAWNNKGYTFNDLTRYEEALVALDQALALDSNLAMAWNNKGIALENMGRNEEALVAYDRALALDSNLAMAWNNKGAALGGLKRHDEALIAYDRALALDDKNAAAWVGKSIALRALWRIAEADAAAIRAKELGWME